MPERDICPACIEATAENGEDWGRRARGGGAGEGEGQLEIHSVE